MFFKKKSIPATIFTNNTDLVPQRNTNMASVKKTEEWEDLDVSDRATC
jgi:hypothetical protein